MSALNNTTDTAYSSLQTGEWKPKLSENEKERFLALGHVEFIFKCPSNESKSMRKAREEAPRRSERSAVDFYVRCSESVTVEGQSSLHVIICLLCCHFEDFHWQIPMRKYVFPNARHPNQNSNNNVAFDGRITPN